jgi:hypothetical protein
MEKEKGLGGDETVAARMVPNGGVSLSEERLRFLATQWEGNFKSLRRMDELSLGETEPATLFVWRLVQP